MNHLYSYFLILTFVFIVAGCGSSGGGSSSPVDSSGGGAATASAEGIGGAGSMLSVTTLQDLTIGSSNTPALVAPLNPPPPVTGYIIIEDDKTLTDVLNDPLSGATLIGGVTVSLPGNLIIAEDTTLFVDALGRNLSVGGDLVVRGYLSSRLPADQLAPIVATVAGNAYVIGEIDNTPNADGGSGAAVSLTASNIYSQGVIAASGNDGAATSGGLGQNITLNATVGIHLLGSTIEAGGGSALTVGLGGNGGAITLNSPSIYVDTTTMLSAGGGDGVAGAGTGGFVTAPGGTFLSFDGSIDCPGGNGLSTLAAGGPGGIVTFDISELQIRGAISIDGGSGIPAGGSGGTFDLTYSTTSVISPDISLDGGAATGTTGVTSGGMGGTIIVTQQTGGTGRLSLFTTPFDLSLNGGNGGATGGDGGVVTIDCPGLLVMNGETYINGGQGVVAGGTGGMLTAVAQNGINNTLSAELNGGTCTGGTGAAGGTLVFENTSSSSLSNSGVLSAMGGYGATIGGIGGTIELVSAGQTTVNGTLVVTGGQTSGITGGAGGSITIQESGTLGIVTNANIEAKGGDSEGSSSANGGLGGQVNIVSNDASVGNYETVNTSGGASYRQTGGNGGAILLFSNANLNGTGGAVTNDGTIICDGGLGLTGGLGGTVTFGNSPDNSGSGTGTNTRFISSSGGPGNNDDGLGGAPGVVTCNGSGTFVNTGTILAVYGNLSPGPVGSVVIQ